MRGYYVYALVPPGIDAGLGAGITGEALVLLSVGARLAAVAGEIDDTPSIAPASLRMHDEIVRRIGRASDAILPFRFGATVISSHELAEGLAPRLDALATALERTRGCDQMTLRLYSDGPEKRPPPHFDAGPGTRWLRERSAQQAGAAPDVARVRDALSSLVRAEAVEAGNAPPLRASVFHLVDRARIATYRAAVEALSAEVTPSRLTATGPWPPYAFTELE